jgi:nitrite reductase (NO-forming)
MKIKCLLFLLLGLLAVFAGGCTPQPPAKAQAAFDAEFKLKTSMEAGKMVFVGVGGEIDGLINPDLRAQPGDAIHLVLVNGDGMVHDLAIPDLGVHTPVIMTQDNQAEVTFETNEAGIFSYFCTISGHRQAGMEGRLVVTTP